MNKGELAKKYFSEGYNCASSVALAFKEELGLDETLIKKLSIGFGGGLARQRLTCGAVSAMTMVITALKSDGENKVETYAMINRACVEFKEKAGSLICAELLDGIVVKDGSPVPEKRTAEYYKKRPCSEICAIAAEIAEKYIK